MRLVVTGAAGAVGSYVARSFGAAELVLTDVAPGFVHLDVTDQAETLEVIASAAPDVVLHLAAATDVDRCERDPDFAQAVNAGGTANVAQACVSTGATLIYVSTGAVFDGRKPTPYIETDDTGPVNVYGRTKLAGEEAAKAIAPCFIVRAGWMMGGEQRDRKFVGKIVEQLTGGARTLRAVDDKFGSPVYALDLLGTIERLATTDAFGLYHVTNHGMCSRYEIAVAICEILGRPDVQVEAVSSESFALPAPRARSEALASTCLTPLGLPPLRSWQEALAAYVLDELAPSATHP